MKQTRIYSLLAFLLVFTLNFSCEEDTDDDLIEDEQSSEITPLTSTESVMTGTWTKYRSAYDYYDCLTLNRDRTATFCRLEKKLSENADRFHERCWQWYIDTEPISPGGNTFNLYIKSDDADSYTAGYIINTSNWTMTDVGSNMPMTDLTTKMEFDFCD